MAKVEGAAWGGGGIGLSEPRPRKTLLQYLATLGSHHVVNLITKRTRPVHAPEGAPVMPPGS